MFTLLLAGFVTLTVIGIFFRRGDGVGIAVVVVWRISCCVF